MCAYEAPDPFSTEEAHKAVGYTVGKKRASYPRTKKAIGGFAEGLETVGIKLSKEGKGMVSNMDKLFADVPVIDATILILGFYAGYNGMTPMTAIMGWLPGFSKQKTIVSSGSTISDPFGFQGVRDTQLNVERLSQIPGGVGIPIIVPKKPENMTDQEVKDEKLFDSYRICLGCCGAIEAYMITRPGSLGAITGLVGTMAVAAAEAIKGIGAIVPG